MKKVLFALLFLFVGCGKKEKVDAVSVETNSVRVTNVRSQKISLEESITGTVRPRNMAEVSSKVMGTILEVPIVLGQHVKKGDVLLTIDAREVEDRYKQAEAQYNKASADFERMSALYKKGGATESEYASFKSQVSLARAVLDEAATMMKYTTVRAPFDGVIAQKFVDRGNFANIGVPLVQIDDIDHLQVQSNIPESLVSSIRLGQKVKVLSALKKDILGTVREISPVTRSVARSFLVKVDLPEATGLRPGQFVRILIPGREQDVLLVPEEALHTRGQIEYVFIVKEDVARMRMVKTGSIVHGQVDILAGLDEGDVVIVSGKEIVKDGQKVDITR